MSDDDLDALWIAAGPPPEEQGEGGCLTVIVLLASGIGVMPLCAFGVAWMLGALP